MSVTRVPEGEIITLHVGPENTPTTYAVGPSCGESNGRWMCATHEASFDNQLMKDSHINGGGDHALVWICFEHGPEEP